MRVATKGILISALFVGISGTVYAQGAGGGGARRHWDEQTERRWVDRYCVGRVRVE
ncbi:hypothetical protein SBC2_09160 [Caballeronia sp. SBC2]|nr:hypothetical protein SBC2_09160 [Caballeronia sp. SBC2]